MTRRVVGRVGTGVLLLVLAATGTAAAQATVTQTDIQRLQGRLTDVAQAITNLRGRDDALARTLQGQLDDLRDETTYLKVKIRKEGNVRYSEYAELRDRIDELDFRARGTGAESSATTSGSGSRSGSATPAVGTASSGATAAAGTGTRATTSAAGSEIPVGTEIDVRLQDPLSSATAKVEDRFQATTMVDLQVNGRTVVPAGSLMRGVVTAVDPATRTNRTGRITVSFDQLTIGGRSYPIRGTVTQALESEGLKGEAARIGTGAGVGAIIGGILGGFKGALAGILIGAGGTVAATEGKDVELPPGTVLRVRLDSTANIPPVSR